MFYQYSQYDIPSLSNRENIRNQAGFSGTLCWPDRLTWTTDINFTHNSDVVPEFRKGYWLWNAAIGLDIFKKKQASIARSVYDLLNQNISVRRSNTDTYIVDRQTIILHRFFMLKLIYSLRKFVGKKKKATVRSSAAKKQKPYLNLLNQSAGIVGHGQSGLGESKISIMQAGKKAGILWPA